MTTGTGLLLAVLLVGSLVAVMARRRRKRSGSAVVASLTGGIPAFRVVTLGLQGSGKTLLLSSIYRYLQTPGDRGYYLRAPHDQLIELNRWYRQAASAENEWPQGTMRGEMREFEFSVMSPVEGHAEPVVKLGYLEYPGELLTDPDAPGSTAQARLLEAIAKADALVGIIDGQRVLQTFAGDRRGALMLEATVDAMVHAMLAARTPIAFVITKWDLLDSLHPDENARLHQVRTLLMNVPSFRDLIREHSSRRVIRLIPVTAVGHDFAVLRDGAVCKKPDGVFEPANVELALSSVVPDILQQTELALDRATREALLAEAGRRSRMGPGEAVHTLASYLSARAGRILVSALSAGVLAEAGLTMLLETRTENGQGHADRLAGLSEADRRAEAVVQARRRVVAELQRQVAVLEAKLPSSRLGGWS